MQGFIDRKVVTEVQRLLDDADYRSELVDHNYRIATKYFSYRALRYGLQSLIRNIRIATD